MKYILLCLFILGLSFGKLHAQDAPKTKTKIYAGYALFLNYNLYSWYQKPNTIERPLSSSGQVFNVLPGLGMNLWLGDIDHWILSLEGGIEYLPFALDTDVYKGMGALSIPVLAKIQFPVAKQKSLWLMLHVGAGVQFLHTDIYARPNTVGIGFNRFFTSIVGEVGVHISTVGYKRQHIREVELFFRAGGAPFGTASFNTGLRLTFWNRFGA
ncbi:MAG: hypothetical protein ACI976_002915 [Aureispira sp.]|jgi:hypothetical protein